MIDVERMRQVAIKRQKQGLVGMILTVGQVLALIERGDAQTKRAIGDDLVTVREAADSLELSITTITQMARRGAVYSELRQAQCADGRVRQVWHVDPDEVGMYAAMSQSEKRALTKARG